MRTFSKYLLPAVLLLSISVSFGMQDQKGDGVDHLAVSQMPRTTSFKTPAELERDARDAVIQRLKEIAEGGTTALNNALETDPNLTAGVTGVELREIRKIAALNE